MVLFRAFTRQLLKHSMKRKMRIGFTYDLKSDYLALGFTPEEVAEFDVPETIEGICAALEGLGHRVDRIGHARSLIERLQGGARWDLVFNICEGVRGVGREAQVPAILDVYGIPYVFSDALVLSLTLHKGLTKRVIRDLGIPTAPFFVVEGVSDIDKVDLAFPLFVKPVAEGTGKGIGPDSKVFDFNQLQQACLQRLKDYGQAVLVERFLPGREITVGIVGNGERARVIGMMEVVYLDSESSGIYSYETKANYEAAVRYRVPEQEVFESCAHVALAAWRGLGCRDGGRVDLRMDENGSPNFMEVNPLAGLNPVHSDLPILAGLAGLGFEELIGLIMEEARLRHFVPANGSGGETPLALILHSPLKPDAPKDELDVLDQVQFFKEGLVGLGYRVEAGPFPLDLSRLGKNRPDFVVNLVETLFGSGRLVHMGPELFEALRIPYTGCPATAIYMTSHKILAKSIMKEHGIPTPGYLDWEQVTDGHVPPFQPYLIKSIWEHASFGLDERGKLLFSGRKELLEGFGQAGRTPGDFFAEAYIGGREFNLSLLGGGSGPEVLPPAEICFSYPEGKPRIVGYRAKWDESSFEFQHTNRTFQFGDSDRSLLDRLTEISLTCWKVFRLKGYARVDFRVDEGGNAFVLEVNANPCISPDSGFMAACRESGYSDSEVIERILQDVNR